jgi:glucosamine-6-phosphate deaminase
MAPRSFVVDQATVRVHAAGEDLARDAAAEAADTIGAAVAARGTAHVMFATGNSQLAFLDELAARDDVDWSSLVGYHLDEYVGIDADHPASFRRYLRERIVDRVHPQRFHYLAGDSPEPGRECARYASLLAGHRLDLCCLGIGENGHLAFNDPPVADFDDPATVKVVELDERCRRQQVGEGHFPSLDAVPPRAITVTIPGLLAARRVLAVVPEARKRGPVLVALTGPVTTDCPASILRTQAHVLVELDADSAAGLGS